MSKVTVALALLLLVQIGSLLGAEPPFLATVTGTVLKQELITQESARIRTSTLNNKRIFEEFEVSPTDYVLVLDTSVSLVLIPKSASSGKPTITVFKLDNLSTVLDTKTKTGRFVSGTATSTATNNVFGGFSGTAQGTFKFTTQNNMLNVTKMSFNFAGRGDDTSPQGSSALLQFKVTSGKSFTQQP